MGRVDVCERLGTPGSANNWMYEVSTQVPVVDDDAKIGGGMWGARGTGGPGAGAMSRRRVV